ncbi:MAG: SAM-dependent chlorinase/fluorinase [Nitrospirota bacterium]
MSDDRIITLTTDFGLKDPFVGEMKGAVLTIHRPAILVDITHEITSHDIREGAFVIGSSYRYFPSGTIHVAVVDPGVGSERRPIIVEADGHCFVGPDNGIFSFPLSLFPDARVFHSTEERYMLAQESPTFQGRDIFAPVAAWLAKGTKVEELGPRINDPEVFSLPLPRIEGETVTGEVISIDKFGNAITTITKNDLSSFGDRYSAALNGTPVSPLKYYGEARDRNLHCLINSSGYLELFVALGSAAALFSIKRGDRVVVRPG